MLYSSPLLATFAIGGFNPLAALAGVTVLFQIFQIFYYGLPQNEPTSGWGLNSDSSMFNYRFKQFIGVQVVCIIIATSVLFAGPELIFFPFQAAG